jgi:broad specificity phosphatase PhoE
VTLTTVHLLRHGEVFNPHGVLYGRLPDYHLSELGQLMAQRVADHLKAGGHRVVHLVASPLERAQETAAPVAEAFGLPIVTDERVIESGNHFEGLQFGVGAGVLRHPRHWWHLRNPFRPSWGEPYEVIADRVHAAARDARDAARGAEAVVVSHQLPVWTARRRAEGRRLWHDPRHRECDLASLTSLVYDDDRLVDVRYDDPARDLVPARHQVSGA